MLLRGSELDDAPRSPPGVARGRFVGGQQSGLAGCKPPPLFTRGASSCSSQGRRQGEPWGASPRPSAPTYLPAPRSEWTKATRPGWRMLIMAPQLPGEDDISLVAVKKIDCEKTYEEAETRRVQYKANAKV